MGAAILPEEDVGSEGSARIHRVHVETGRNQCGHRDIHANDTGAFVGRKRRDVRDLDEWLVGDARGGSRPVKDGQSNGDRRGDRRRGCYPPTHAAMRAVKLGQYAGFQIGWRGNLARQRTEGGMERQLGVQEPGALRARCEMRIRYSRTGAHAFNGSCASFFAIHNRLSFFG